MSHKLIKEEVKKMEGQRGKIQLDTIVLKQSIDKIVREKVKLQKEKDKLEMDMLRIRGERDNMQVTMDDRVKNVQR